MSALLFIFTRHRSLSSAAIRAGAWWGPWSHCGMVMPDGDVDESVARLGGVVRTPLRTVLDRASHFEVLSLPVQDGKRDEAYAWATSTVGAKYDWGGLLSIVALRRDWQAPDRWYCSERAAFAAKVAGVDLVAPDMIGVSPTQLSRLMRAAGAEAVGAYL